MIQFTTPIPVIIKATKQEAYAIYVQSGGTFENDIWCVAICEGGQLLHCLTDQLLLHKNATMGIHATPGLIKPIEVDYEHCTCRWPDNHAGYCKKCGGVVNKKSDSKQDIG